MDTGFDFFAPRAANVTLVIGESNHPEKTNSFLMKMGMDGVWECKIDYKKEDLFYFYEVCNYLNTNEKGKFSKRVLDPYAKLCAGNRKALPSYVKRQENLVKGLTSSLQT